MKRAVFAVALTLAATAAAADHGPVFGYATPVNSQGEWSFDTGLIARYGSRGTASTSASQLGYGFTPHITAYTFLPATFGSGNLPETRIAGGDEYDANVAWRFLHSVKSVGRRVESTASAGIVVPGPQQDDGVLHNLHRAPGVSSTIASGFASRSQYLWLGGGYTYFPESHNTQRPSTASWSAVYGYRPASLRRGYDQWDYRGFAELTGEHTTSVRAAGIELPHSTTTSLWLGPSILAIFKNVAIEGGVQAPVYRDASSTLYGRERLRIAINISYLKYSARTAAH